MQEQKDRLIVTHRPSEVEGDDLRAPQSRTVVMPEGFFEVLREGLDAGLSKELIVAFLALMVKLYKSLDDHDPEELLVRVSYVCEIMDDDSRHGEGMDDRMELIEKETERRKGKFG